VGGGSAGARSRYGAPHVLRRRAARPSRGCSLFSRGDHLGTDSRSLGQQRVTGASPPQPPTRLGHRSPPSPRSPDSGSTAASRPLPRGAGPPRRHGAKVDPAVRERPAGSTVLGSAADRSRAAGARRRPPSLTGLRDEAWACCRLSVNNWYPSQQQVNATGKRPVHISTWILCAHCEVLAARHPLAKRSVR